MNKLVSVDFYADFGCLKKPDTNTPVYLTFNMLHKPALLGILGAIVGLEGFAPLPPKKRKKKTGDLFSEQEEKPVVAPYYEALKDLQIGIQPLYHENGVFAKTTVTYNNGVGYANIQGSGPTNLVVTEQMLIRPAYRCFILINQQDELHETLAERLRRCEAVYLPYIGKNEFSLWWTNWQTYNHQPFNPEAREFQISSLFIKDVPVKGGKAKTLFELSDIPTYVLFETLPVKYDEAIMQYEYGAFAYTSCKLKCEYQVSNLYQLSGKDGDSIVQLF